MMGLTFAAPLVLSALIILPALYYILRVMPPPARRLFFPPAELFLKPDDSRKTPIHTPWYILLMRLLLLASLIFAMAGPVWRPKEPVGHGPLLVVIDDSWAAASGWAARIVAAQDAIQSAQNAGRRVAVALASEGGREINFGTAQQARARLDAVQPKPLLFDRDKLLEAIQNAAQTDQETVWISDGLGEGGGRDFATALLKLGAVKVYDQGSAHYGITGLKGNDIKLLSSGSAQPQQLRALDEKGRILASYSVDFQGNKAEVKLDMPLELRNEVARLELAGQAAAGAVYLTDDSNKRARIGIFAEVSADIAQQNLLNPAYYLERAVTPFADIVEAKPDSVQPINDILQKQPSVLVLSDVAGLSPETAAKISDFVGKGGLLVRFSGPHLAKQADELLPVPLRGGGRAMGGALTWDQPKLLAPFDEASPFAGLIVPKDVTVSSQVLAEPDAKLDAKVWARLSDGTPLVTADKRGKGTIVLVHVTANAAWSNLALSGLFVEMMQRIVTFAPRAAGTPAALSKTAQPLKNLDGFGVLGAPTAEAQALEQGIEPMASMTHPPGLYGDSGQVIAVNALNDKSTLSQLDLSGLAVTKMGGVQQAVDFRPLLLMLALMLFIADTILTLLPRKAAVIAGLLVAGLISLPEFQPAKAEAPTLSAKDIETSLNVHLGYIITGDADVDSISRAGLKTLSEVLSRRTSVIPGDPVGLDPAKDLLDLYPMIYWPVSVRAEKPSAEAVARLGAYMQHGGTLVVDTRDAQMQRPDGSSAEQVWLQQALRGLAIPPLEVVPRDHVVTKTFYLLDGFYGRTMTGLTYIEVLPPADDDLRPARAGDSVSPIIITSNDLAAGWAADDNGNPLVPLTSGGARQRELALRGGVNLVMYTLTGNYKSDQVHVPALLDRLRH